MASAVSVAVCLTGCGNRGLVTFSIETPGYQPLNPVTNQVSEFALKRMDGTLVAVASEGPGAGDTLPLGPLATSTAPFDLQVQVLSGSTLLGMGRVRDVTFENGIEKSYSVGVRKPLITVGSALTVEMLVGNLVKPGKIIDPNAPTASNNLSEPAAGPKLPPQTAAAAATWDGRFLLAADNKALTVIDTGSGKPVGSLMLGFAALRVAVGARDSAAAVLDPAGTLLLFGDVPTLTSNPAAAMPARIAGQPSPRTITFSPDGLSVYVLSGGSVDPCSPTAMTPPPNMLTAIGVDGSVQGSWALPGFVSDVAIDQTNGKVVIADTTNNQVSTFDVGTPFGMVRPQKLASATCPSGLRVASGDVFVVTNDRDPSFSPPAFIMQRVNVKSGMSTKIAFETPVFSSVDTMDMPTPDMNTQLRFQFTPSTIVAYELALTPDATRAVFAVRARYHEANAPLTVFTNNCRATYEIAEYGYYDVDTRTGQSTYFSRSQIVQGTNGTANCITCTVLQPNDVALPCKSTPGDRPAGISSVFGGP